MQPKTKGVLDSFIFSPAQKAEYYRLLQLGIPDSQARILAQALKKSAALRGPTLAELPQPVPTEQDAFNSCVARGPSVSTGGQAEDTSLGAWRALAKSGYHAAFVAEAKRRLDSQVFAQLHDRARSSAGGSASGVSRRAAKNPHVQDRLTWLGVLNKEVAEVRADIAKSAPVRSEVHVDQPISGKIAVRVPKIARGIKQIKEEEEPKPLSEARTVAKKDGSLTPPDAVRSACKRGLELAPKYGGKGLTEGAKSRARAMASGKAVTKEQLSRMRSFFARHSAYAKPSDPPSPGYVAWQLWGGDAGKRWCESQLRQLDKAETAPAPDPYPLPQGPESINLNAQRLIAGMDYHLGNGTDDVNEARTLASRMLASDMGSFDNLFQSDGNVRSLTGLDVDLGSGAHRHPGYLGLDLFPYDYGTAIFDVTELPLPFDNGEVRAMRMVEMPLDDLDANAFLQDVQRVLTYGGVFTYIGEDSLAQRVDQTQLPGLRIDSQSPEPLEEEPSVYIETFERVRARLPWVYGADTDWLHKPEQSIEQLMLNQALGVPTYTLCEQAMANLLTKSNSYAAEAEVVKAEAHQRIVTSVVYAPDELDTDGEWMSADDIEKAAHMFLTSGGYIGSEHGGKPIGADVVESYIAPCELHFDTAQGQQTVPKGSWVMSVKFSSDKEWRKLLSGDYTGFSVGGFAAV